MDRVNAPVEISEADSGHKELVELSEDELTVTQNLLSVNSGRPTLQVGTKAFRDSLSERLADEFYNGRRVSDEITKTGRSAIEVLADSADLYERKNADYGDSWKLVGELLATILQHQGMDELTIPVEANALNSLGLFFRRGDKFTREVNGWFAADELQVNESIAETHNDDVPYAAMHTELAEEAAATDGEDQ